MKELKLIIGAILIFIIVASIIKGFKSPVEASTAINSEMSIYMTGYWHGVVTGVENLGDWEAVCTQATADSTVYRRMLETID